MSMLSYKQYKLLHENLDSVIGLSKPTNLGVRSEAGQLFGMMSKMGAGGPPPGLGGPPPMGKKKPPMGDDADMDDMDDEDHPHDEEGDDEDMDDTDMGDDEDGDEDMGDEDMGDEEGDEEGGDDMGGADMGGADMGPMGAGGPPPGMGGPMGGPDMAGGLGGPPMGKKKKPMPPQMMSKMGAMYMKKEAHADPQDSKMKGQNKKNAANDQKDDGKGTAQKKTTFVREVADEQDEKMKAQNKADGLNDSCCSKCGKGMMKKSKKCCKMTKEQREFNDSLMRQAGSLKFQQDELGFWVPVKEDVLIPTQQAQEDNEPQPGKVGFAPQTKIGLAGSNFTEWATRHAAAVKKNK